jgi:hypothetical protein
MTDDKQSEALQRLQESQEQTRTSSDAVKAAETDDSKSVEDVVAEAFESLDDGDLHPNVTFRDEKLAALMHALDETNRLEDVADAAAGELDRDLEEGVGKSDAYRLLIRVGLTTVTPSTTEAVKEGYRQYQMEQDYNF